MTHPNAAKGRRWELATERYLAERLGRHVTAPRQRGRLDVGDLQVGSFALQCKDVARLALPEWVRDAEDQAANAGLPFGAAAVKSRGKGPADGLVVMSLATFRRVLESES